MLDDRNFAAFILTHGRPDSVITYSQLRKHGYTGRIYLIIDNEDKTADQYYKNCGKDQVIMFDKEAAAKITDTADSRTDRRATVFARNASFEIAEQLGLTYFMQLDDDYQSFAWRYLRNPLKCGSHPIRSLDQVFDAMIQFLDDSQAKSIALGQAGDWLNGYASQAAKQPLLRKCMNSWLFRTDRPVKFVGRMNDDVNTYVINGTKGDLFFTVTCACLSPMATQQGAGGMTEMYLDTGTYMKSMYTVMLSPSSALVKPMISPNSRLHHFVKWNNTVPKIINDRHRKKR